MCLLYNKAEVITALGIILLNQTTEKEMEMALEIKMPRVINFKPTVDRVGVLEAFSKPF